MPGKRKRFSQTAIFWRLGAECERCGTRDGLTAHHRNGDSGDDTPENLGILCLGCHRREEGHV